MNSKRIIIILGGIIIIIVGSILWYLMTPRSASNSQNQNNPSNTPALKHVEQAQIVEAVLNQQRILSSKNTADIKTYFTKLAVTAEDKKELSKTTNQDFLKMAAAMTVGGTVTAEELTAPAAVWNVSSDIAVIRIQKQGKNAMYTVQRVNGAWY